MPTQPGPRIERHASERLRARRRDDLPDVDAHAREAAALSRQADKRPGYSVHFGVSCATASTMRTKGRLTGRVYS